MKKTICIISTALWTATSAVAAVQPEQAPVADKPPGWQPAPANVTEWADRCTDSTVNGWGFKDPKNFVKLMETFSDPTNDKAWNGGVIPTAQLNTSTAPAQMQAVRYVNGAASKP